MKEQRKLKTKDIVLMGILTAILFVQEEALAFLANVQLTVFLIVLYTKVIGWKKTSIIVVLHCILDNLVMGSFNIANVPAMLLGWLVIPLTLGTVLKNVEKPILLALLGIFYAFFYDFCFAVSSLIILDISLAAWYASGIIFDVILAASSFLSILWLYNPCKKVIMIFQDEKVDN